MQNSSKPVIFWIPLVLISVLGFVLVWYCTVWGAGLISDSFQYIASARSLASGQGLGYPDDNGLIHPLVQYPPLFSVMLAMFECAGVDSLFAARLLNAGLFAVNIGLVGASIKEISRSIGFSLFGALLCAVSWSQIEAHAWVLSEPLFIFFSLLAFLWLGTYLKTSRRRWLIASAVAAGLAVLTRYVGLALLPAALIVLWWKSVSMRRPKWADIAAYSLIVLFPITVWSWRNYLLNGELNNRSMQWIPLTVKNVYSLVNTIFTWFVPESLVNGRERWGLLVLVFIFIGGVIGVYLMNRRVVSSPIKLSSMTQPLFLLHAIYIPIYCGVVIFSKMLFSPVLVSMIIPASSMLGDLWRYRQNWRRVFLSVIVVYLVVYFASNSAPFINKFHQQGIGLARKTWQTSQVIQALPEYAAMPIYSNSPSTLYFWTERMGSSVQMLDQKIKSGSPEKAVLVVFYHLPSNSRLLRLEEALTLVKSDEMAKIYLYEP
jgi:4-amino-4-deoxy-L-arabinose transferase-like glycosyltransferase